MTKVKAQVKENLVSTCTVCGDEVYQCDECENYINDKGTNVICDEEKHYCLECEGEITENMSNKEFEDYQKSKI